MRILTIAAALALLAPASACGQQRDSTARPDTVARDTVARTDSIVRADSIARADSLRRERARRDSLIIERESERVRNEPPRLPFPPPEDDVLLHRDTTVGRRGPSLRGGVGFAVYTPYADAESFEVTSPVAAAAHLGVAWPIGSNVAVVATGRGSVAGLDVDPSTLDPGGTVVQIDALVGFEWRSLLPLPGARGGTLSLLGGAAWMNGPDELLLFRESDFHLAAELGGAVQLLADAPFLLTLALEYLWLDLPAGAEEFGWEENVSRVLLGVQYGL